MFVLGLRRYLHAALSARQLDADKFAAREIGVKDEPVRALQALRALLAKAVAPPMPAQIELGAEQIMHGRTPACKTSPPICTPTPNPGPSIGSTFARPVQPMSR